MARELKARSGPSYGTPAKRLHPSASTPHRSCNGTALPHEHVPAEHFARVRRAAPEEPALADTRRIQGPDGDRPDDRRVV
ncbi:hypothetical protein ACIOJE_21600 [Kitasatospora sp. NPDC087861]|uniref:hypothetical protein n=1 Tax=Kitasatospora sp. NPDC087861 TaxID=3364070 RepID=UPI00381B2645